MDDVLGILKNISDLDCKFDSTTTSHNFPVSPGVGIHLRLARDGLNSNKWEERFAATTRLGRLAGSETSTVVELLRGLRDEHPCVRAGAVSSLAILHQASPQLPCCSASPQLPCYAQHEPITLLLNPLATSQQLPCTSPQLSCSTPLLSCYRRAHSEEARCCGCPSRALLHFWRTQKYGSVWQLGGPWLHVLRSQPGRYSHMLCPDLCATYNI